jgi:accessory gene regulator protein AgrB
MIGTSKFVPFDDIIIADKNASIWTYKPGKYASKRLDVTTRENQKDKSLVNVLVKTTINLKIANPKALKILKVKREKKGKK